MEQQTIVKAELVSVAAITDFFSRLQVCDELVSIVFDVDNNRMKSLTYGMPKGGSMTKKLDVKLDEYFHFSGDTGKFRMTILNSKQFISIVKTLNRRSESLTMYFHSDGDLDDIGDAELIRHILISNSNNGSFSFPCTKTSSHEETADFDIFEVISDETPLARFTVTHDQLNDLDLIFKEVSKFDTILKFHSGADGKSVELSNDYFRQVYDAESIDGTFNVNTQTQYFKILDVEDCIFEVYPRFIYVYTENKETQTCFSNLV